MQNLAFSILEAALFPRKLVFKLRFFYFCVTFHVGSGSKSGSETGIHTVPVPLREKVAVPAVPLPKHCL
jgi:hypothetical protein